MDWRLHNTFAFPCWRESFIGAAAPSCGNVWYCKSHHLCSCRSEAALIHPVSCIKVLLSYLHWSCSLTDPVWVCCQQTTRHQGCLIKGFFFMTSFNLFRWQTQKAVVCCVSTAFCQSSWDTNWPQFTFLLFFLNIICHDGKWINLTIQKNIQESNKT